MVSISGSDVKRLLKIQTSAMGTLPPVEPHYYEINSITITITINIVIIMNNNNNNMVLRL